MHRRPIEQLKAATLLEHDTVEAAFELDRVCKDQQSYIGLLRRMLPFYQHVEADFAHFRTYEEIKLLEPSPRSSLLIASDLFALGSERNLELLELESLTSLAESIGALYVLEGSALGGQIISKTLLTSLGDATPVTFFRGLAKQTATRWRAVGAAIDAYVGEYNCLDEIVEGAKQTFSTMTTVLQERHAELA